LLAAGFTSWHKRDFQAFLRGSEKHGRKKIAEISKEIEGKTEAEVKAYHSVFWKRYKEISDWEKYIKNIERGESRIKKAGDQIAALNMKMKKYKDPYSEIELHYGPGSKSKTFTEEEDKFLICSTFKVGFGNWEDVKMEIKKSPVFKFDWFLKSRGTQDLARRVDSLMKIIQKEMNEEMEKKKLQAEKRKEREKEKQK